MLDPSMTVRVCVLIVVAVTVCQGAAAPVQQLNCGTERNSDCIECICETVSKCSSEPCSRNVFPERRKRQVKTGSANAPEGVNTSTQSLAASPTQSGVSTSAQPVAATSAQKPVADTSPEPIAATSPEPIAATSAQPVAATAAQPVAATSAQSTSADAQLAAGVNATTLTSAAPGASTSRIVPSLPPPPHPLAEQATAVKPRSCKSGSTWEEECNTCWCLDNGMAACTVKRCEIVSPVATTKPTSNLPSDTHTSPSLRTPPTSSVQSATPAISPPQIASSEVSTGLPRLSTVLPTTSSVLPSTTTVLPSASTVAPSTSSALPTSFSTSVPVSLSSAGGTS